MVGQRALQPAVGIHQADSAPVGQPGHVDGRDRFERGMRLQRARQHRARRRQHLEPPPCLLGHRAGGPLGPEQALALRLVARALLGGGDERIGHLLDLADLAGRHVRRVATAERQRGTPQLTDGAADAPRDDQCGDAAEQARQQDAAAVGQRRPPGPAVDAGERNADRHRPAAALDAAEGGHDRLTLQRVAGTDAFVGASRHEPLQARRRRGAQVLRVGTRARDARALRVEDRDDPVVGHPLARDHVEERLRVDDAREHEAQAAVAQHGHAHRHAELTARAAPHRAHQRRLRLQHLVEAFRLGDRHVGAAERIARVHQHLAVGAREDDGAPVRARRGHRPSHPPEGRHVAAVERRRSGERLQHLARAAQLGVDGERERTGQIEARAFRLLALLLDQREQADA